MCKEANDNLFETGLNVQAERILRLWDSDQTATDAVNETTRHIKVKVKYSDTNTPKHVTVMEHHPPRGPKRKITRPALAKRINEHFSRSRLSLGPWLSVEKAKPEHRSYIVTSDYTLVTVGYARPKSEYIDIEELGRELGVLQEDEFVEDVKLPKKSRVK